MARRIDAIDDFFVRNPLVSPDFAAKAASTAEKRARYIRDVKLSAAWAGLGALGVYLAKRKKNKDGE